MRGFEHEMLKRLREGCESQIHKQSAERKLVKVAL